VSLTSLNPIRAKPMPALFIAHCAAPSTVSLELAIYKKERRKERKKEGRKEERKKRGRKEGDKGK
jgi:hypothetical protein